jgi:hypothetical protein
MSPFQPKGPVPEWRMIYDVLLDKIEPGAVITYEQLDKVLGRPFKQNRTPLYRARSILGDVRKRWLEPAPGTGYRCIPASEMTAQAVRRREAGKRRLEAAVQVGRATDLSQLTAEQLARHDRQHEINQALVAAILNHESRLTRIERALRAAGKLAPESDPPIQGELSRPESA